MVTAEAVTVKLYSQAFQFVKVFGRSMFSQSCLWDGRLAGWPLRTLSWCRISASVNTTKGSITAQIRADKNATIGPLQSLSEFCNHSVPHCFREQELILHEKYRSHLLGHHCVFLQLKSASALAANSRRRSTLLSCHPAG